MHSKNIESAPKISVIVPIYNVGRYLRQCLESLVKQTLKDIEFICVNDGSTDNSLEILEEYARSDERIKVISKLNSGYGNSMNIGMEQARGKYIGIIESDDFASEDMFEQLYLQAEQSDADFIKSNYFTYCESGIEYIENLKGMPYNTIFSPRENWGLFKTAPSIWSALYKTDFLKKNHITFLETPGASNQDISFFFLTLLYAEKAVCIRDAFLNYRIDNMNSSLHSTDRVFFVMFEFEKIQKCYVQENRIEQMKALEVMKFNYYYGNYNKVAPMYQYAFLYEMHKELADDEKKGVIDKKYWKDDEWERLQKIKNEPNKHFYDTNLYYLNQYRLKDLTINSQIEAEARKEVIRKATRIIIYGAGIYAEKISKEVERLNTISAYAVTEMKEDAVKEINGIKVCEIKELIPYSEETLVIVAVKKTSQLQIINLLHKLGFKKDIISEWTYCGSLNARDRKTEVMREKSYGKK